MALLSTASTQGQALIHEPFEYAEGNVNGLNGGVGFDGAWSNTRNSPAVEVPDLEWGGLVTTGNSVRGNAWSGLVRPIGDTLSNAGLMSNGSSLWFSAVMDLTGQNFSNADLNLALGNAAKFNSSTFGERQNLDGASSEGIGFTHSGGTIQGAYWQDIGDSDTISERATSNSSLSLSSGSPRALVVGRIDWGATAVANETLTLFAPSTDLELGAPILSSFSIPALDQSTFDSVLIQFKDQSRIDEIRFGSIIDDVVVRPDPLKLFVNTTSGRTKLIGDDDVDVSISYYQVTSSGDSLNPSGWSSFSDQDIDGNGPADGSGNGWEEAGGSSSSALAEAYLLGETVISAGAEIDLGRSYDKSIDARDLFFEYATGSGNSFEGVIEYFNPAVGDADNNGKVEFSDFNTLANNYSGATTGKDWEDGDFDGDGDVAFSDFNLLANNWGFDANESAVQADVASAVSAGEAKLIVGADGSLTIEGGNVDLNGYSITSASGKLIADGDNNASPFTFYISNTATDVTAGNLGTFANVDGLLVLDASVNPADLQSLDLVFEYGTAAGSQTGVVEIVPEPTSLALLGLGGLLLARRRRD